MDSTPIYRYAAPTSACLEPPKPSKPILTPGYELRLCFIKLIRDKFFLGEGEENPYSHLQEFEQTCACLHIASMSDETLWWKLFPFSLMGRAKRWYRQTVGSMQGDWKTLCSKFCLAFFPFSRVVHLQKEVLSFKQKEQESLGMSDKTVRCKRFPFSLMGRAKHWYNQTIGSMQGDWETLCSSFLLSFLSYL